MRPDVIVFAPALRAPLNMVAPKVEGPAVRFVVKRLVEEARVEKRLVVVALVEVEKVVVSARIVEEEFTKMPRVVVGARYPSPWTVKSRLFSQ